MPKLVTQLLQLPRKLLAFGITSALIFLSGFALDPAHAATVTTALVGTFTAFVGAHTATDVLATKAITSKAKPPKDPPEEGS